MDRALLSRPRCSCYSRRIDVSRDLLQHGCEVLWPADVWAVTTGQLDGLHSEPLASSPALPRWCDRAVFRANNIASRHGGPGAQCARFLHRSFRIEQPARRKRPVEPLRGAVMKYELQCDVIVHRVLAHTGGVQHGGISPYLIHEAQARARNCCREKDHAT